MALSEPDRAILESSLGRVSADDLEDVENRVTRLGSPYAAALELLLIERADLDRHSDSLASADARITIVDQRKRLDAAIQRLSDFLSTTTDVSLSTAGLALLARAGGQTSQTRSIDITSTNPRRAG